VRLSKILQQLCPDENKSSRLETTTKENISARIIHLQMQKEYFGIGCIEQLGEILSREKPKRIFLVRGKKSYYQSGVHEKLSLLLEAYEMVHFTYHAPDVKIEDVKRGKELFQAENCDYTIAIGGGSALDLGKAVTLLASHEGNAEEYIQKKIPLHPRKYPLIAIPTTIGTGSEATHFATIYLDKIKWSLAHPSLIPDHALIDPSLTLSLSSYQTASTGIDALAQAIESYWSVCSTPDSQNYAREAIRLCLTNLKAAVDDAANLEAHAALARAANLSGKAINVSFTTACHAISYPITAHFGIPHGHAVALTLPGIAQYNAGITKEDCLEPRETEYVKRVLQDLCQFFFVSSPESLKAKIETLMDEIGLERKLTALGIKTEEDRDLIIKQGFNPERMKNNPRLVKEEDLRKILEEIS